jgi:hypothetical protein
MANSNKDEFLWRDKPIADRIMGWFKEHEGKNIFGQPVEPLTDEELFNMVAGVTNPFRAVGSAKNFVKIFGYVKGWRDHNLDIPMETAKRILKRVSMATDTPIGSLIKFAKDKLVSPAVKKNRKIALERLERHKKGEAVNTRLFGGWKGGKSAGEAGKAITRSDFDNILREELYGRRYGKRMGDIAK